jgi:CRP-like cAMP-binding protein
MSISVLARQLMSQEIFRGLSPLQLTEIVRQSERVVYRPGQYIIEAGASADAAVVVIAGDAIRFPENLSGQGAMQAEPLTAGSLLSELAMLVDHAHGATVIAHTTVRALRITREALQSQMLDDPHLADHFVERIAERLSRVATELRLIDHALATAEPAPA